MLLTAILVPLFPLFSRLVAKEDTEGVRHYYLKGLGTLIYAGSYLMVCIFVVRTDAIRVALERGAFNYDASVLVSDILFFITLSIIPYVVRDSATRLFYSFKNSKTPFIIAIYCIGLKVLFNFLLVKPMGINGIALSTALVTFFNGLMLTILLRKHISIGYKNLIINCLKILLTCAITFVIGYTVSFIYSNFIEWNFITGLIKLVTVGIFMTISYFLLSYIFKIEYLNELIQRIKEKINKGKNVEI